MLAILIAGVGAGAAIDLATRRIPNGVVATIIVVGVVAAGTGASDISVRLSLLGLGAGILLMLPGHLFGGTGAGGVKLFGAVGAVVGVERILWAFCYTALVGGVLALIWALCRRRLALTVGQALASLGRPQRTRPTIVSPEENNRFAYGPAIAVGSVLGLLLKG